MARKFTASKTHLRPDPRFNSKLAGKFINCVMHNGKKSVAQRIFYDALDLVQKRLPNESPIDVFTRAVENVKPAIEVRSKRVGGATYQVPMQVNKNSPADAVDSLDLDGGAREEGAAHGDQAGRRVRGRVQPRRGRGHPPRERPPHGRRQQGIRPLRLVSCSAMGSTALRADLAAFDHGARPAACALDRASFPGPAGAVADWLVRRRGYRARFIATQLEPRENWPASVGKGLDVQVFGLGGIAREQAVSWSRTLERSLCYSYGCWEVLEKKRPRPIDLVVGRSMGLGSSLFAPVYCAGGARGLLSRLLLSRPPPRPGRRSRPRNRRRPTSTGGGRWPRSTCSTWSRPPWPGRRLAGSAGCIPAEYRDDVPRPARRHRHSPISPDRRGTRRPRRRGRSPGG